MCWAWPFYIFKRSFKFPNSFVPLLLSFSILLFLFFFSSYLCYFNSLLCPGIPVMTRDDTNTSTGYLFNLVNIFWTVCRKKLTKIRKKKEERRRSRQCMWYLDLTLSPHDGVWMDSSLFSPLEISFILFFKRKEDKTFSPWKKTKLKKHWSFGTTRW